MTVFPPDTHPACDTRFSTVPPTQKWYLLQQGGVVLVSLTDLECTVDKGF